MATEIVTASAVSYFIAGDSSLVTSLTNNGIIEAAEDWIAKYCRRWDVGGAHWARDGREEYIDGELSGNVLLKWNPIEAISSVQVVTSSTGAYTYTLTDLECDGIAIASLSAVNPGIVGRLGLRSGAINIWDMGSGCGWDRATRVPFPNHGGGRQRVKVSYTGGYTTIPPAIVLAAKKMSAQVYYNRTRDPTVKATTLGQFSETYGGATTDTSGISAPGEVLSLLENFRSYISMV